MKLKQYQLLTMGLVGLTACTGAVLASSTTFANNDSAVDEINITVPTACTMEGTSQTSHNATINPGTYSGASGSAYESGIGSTTLTTYCNDNNGFSIYAIGFTNDTAGNNVLQGTSASGNATIASALYDSNSPTTSTWSMKVTAGRDSGDTTSPNNLTIDNSFNNFHVVPDDTAGYTRVAHKAANTDMTQSTGGATITTTYDAYISTTQPADTYTGKVKYVLVHPYAADPDPYKPSTGVSSISELTYMQDFVTLTSTEKTNVLGSMTTGAQYQLRDSRDNKQYYISKLADGNVWMTQNLDHDIDSSYNYNSTNTDVPANWNDTLVSTYPVGTTTWNNSASAPESYNPGDFCWNGVLDSNFGVDDFSSGTTACSSTTAISDHYHIGNYYNWTAAVAMQDSSSYDYGDSETDVDQSICPAGWRLPIGGTTNTGTKSFEYLVDQASLTSGTNGNIQNLPAYFVYGEYWGGSSEGVGTNGSYWSSVIDDSNSPYGLEFNSTGGLDAQGFPWTGNGSSVRCLVR